MTPILVLGPSRVGAETLIGSDTDIMFPAQIWDAGFDVFVGSMRGAEGTSCETTDEDGNTEACAPELSSWATSGRSDVRALVSEVLKNTGKDKISIVGLADGASAALYGLAVDDSLGGALERTILLAPCVFMDQDMTIEEQLAWTTARDELGIVRTTSEDLEAHTELVCEAAKADGITENSKAALDGKCDELTELTQSGLTGVIEWGSEDYWF